MPGELSSTLKSRTYVGLIVAQFTNAFNDQAAHIIGNFYACDMLVRYAKIPGVTADMLIGLVTLCFIAPLLMFSPLAGVLADKYSKRDIIFIVKCFETVFMAIGLIALLLPLAGNSVAPDNHVFGITSATLMVLVVFLMGVQTAFLVPCKYGIMPEILHPSTLSRGNGVLESTTFVAHLGGTSFGGILYSLLKHADDVETGFRHSNVWIAGVVLFLLAITGAIGAWQMGRVPAASPARKLTFSWLAPLAESYSVLRRSRPLALAVVGIAFASFMTLYSRQTLLNEGETSKDLQEAFRLAGKADVAEALKESDAATNLLNQFGIHASPDQRAELRVAVLIAMVGLGIGIGSLLAGRLSGSKLELGLVPIGASALVVMTAMLAWLLDYPRAMMLCLVLVGVSAGLYVVPMYTMLQHRAPREAKGNIVAASNFVNVAGGLLAILIFSAITMFSRRILTSGITLEQALHDPELREQFLADTEARMWIPKLLFLGASAMTVVMLVAICRQLPDFYTRALLWIFSQRHYHLRVEGMQYLPQDGPAILATNCAKFETGVHLITATDRYVHIFLDEDPQEDAATAFLRFLSRLTSTSPVPPEDSNHSSVESACATLGAGDLVSIPLDSRNDTLDDERLFEAVQQRANVEIVPVLCMVQRKTKAGDPQGVRPRRATVVFGPPLPPGATITQVQDAILELGGVAPDSFLTMYPD